MTDRVCISSLFSTSREKIVVILTGYDDGRNNMSYKKNLEYKKDTGRLENVGKNY